MTADRTPHVAVIGGGIAGLAVAHRLTELSRERQHPLRVTLVEAKPHLGGSIGTERVDGFVIESGPDSFISEKPWALRLCERIGFTSRLVGTRDEFRRTYVVHDGRLHPLPDGFLLLAPTRFWPLVTTGLFTWPGKMRMALDLVLPRGPQRADESLGSFVSRRLGREALERVAQPLVGGIYTADPDTLSLAATMPRFLEMERQWRSIIWAMWRAQRRAPAAARASSGARWSLFVSVDDGMQSLVDAIAQRLPDGAVRLGHGVAGIERSDTWRIGLTNGDSLEADAVVLATPAHLSARFVEPFDAPLAGELRGIPYASSATVSLAYRRDHIPRPLDSFGFVVPLVESRSIVACTFSSLKYPGRAPDGMVLCGPSSAGRCRRTSTTRTTRSWSTVCAASCASCSASRRIPCSRASIATPGRCRSIRWVTSTAWRASTPDWRSTPGSRSPATPTAALASRTASTVASWPPKRLRRTCCRATDGECGAGVVARRRIGSRRDAMGATGDCSF